VGGAFPRGSAAGAAGSTWLMSRRASHHPAEPIFQKRRHMTNREPVEAGEQRICPDCSNPWILEPGEVDFMVQRDLSLPRRCGPCRRRRRQQAAINQQRRVERC
jgi:hypothetical protein